MRKRLLPWARTICLDSSILIETILNENILNLLCCLLFLLSIVFCSIFLRSHRNMFYFPALKGCPDLFLFASVYIRTASWVTLLINRLVELRLHMLRTSETDCLWLKCIDFSTNHARSYIHREYCLVDWWRLGVRPKYNSNKNICLVASTTKGLFFSIDLNFWLKSCDLLDWPSFLTACKLLSTATHMIIR